MEQRNTRQRQMVLDVVRGRCDHPTADDIYLEVRARDPRVSRGTVYRNLGVLSEAGLIIRVEATPADRYDVRLDNHYHIRCTQCGMVCDAPVEYQQAYDCAIEAATGFKVTRHETMFNGLCPACQKQRQGKGSAT